MTLLLLVLIAATAEAPWSPPTDAAPIPITEAATPARYEMAPPAVTPAPVEPATTMPATTPLPTTTTGQPSFEQRLIALELALSTIVVERPSFWRFERLDSEATELLTLASNDAQRNAVRDTAARIDNFRRLGAQLRNEAQLRNGAEDAGGWRSPTSQAVAQSTPRLAPPTQLTSTRDASGHDASGVLRPVVSQRPDAPKYAVIDDAGRIAALVTPTPELDTRLKGMVGQRVGLDGQRGYRTDLRREHVVAECVTPLDTLRR
jgi:hypothetical protein